MDYKKYNRFTAIAVFIVSLGVYIKTLSSTVVFWDVGEFCAAAFSLQIPHPPGAPLFLIIARLFSMVPFVQDIAVRIHLLSAVSSAVTCGLLYLIIVDLIIMWRGVPAVFFDRVVVYGSAAIGALSLAFTSTFWSNAVEAEVYGLSMAFVSLIIFLGLHWYKCTEEGDGDRYILLIAYIIGLSVGVHHIVLLIILPLLLIFFYRHYNVELGAFVISMFLGFSSLALSVSTLSYLVTLIGKYEASTGDELFKAMLTSAICTTLTVLLILTNKKYFNRPSFLFGIFSLIIFAVIYPGIIKIFSAMLNGNIFGIKSNIIIFVPVAFILGALYFAYYSIKNKKRVLIISILSLLLIIVGYSTYTTIFIRAKAHPPMNENDPSNLERFVSYLNREQYGNAPIFDRRWDIDPDKKRYHQNYSSDLDYMWRYQIVKMYLRYLGWNYIGSEGDFKNAGVDWKQFYLIPFFLGILGAFYQWRKQPYFAFILTAIFIIMGILLALYQNQQEPQPRERDYFYLGSFFVFSLWIAYGLLAVIDFIKNKIAKEQTSKIVNYTFIGLAFVLVPVNMMRTNYHQANRTGNYVAWDYSYNVLQSCEQDAILITNGDNDTFPLWYLQDVEGIRCDIRIVNLSLLNTPWYIKQLKNEMPYHAKKVPISISDVDIENIQPVRFEPRVMELYVPSSIIQTYQSKGDKWASLIDTSISNSGVIRFFMPNTLQFGNIKLVRIQDITLLNIIRTSRWERPIYFSLTVPNENKIGLQNYIQLCGLAMKLAPLKMQDYWTNLDEKTVYQNLFTEIKQPSKEQQSGFLWRGFQDSTIYYDEETRHLISTKYRNLFLSYALYRANMMNQLEEVSTILDHMEKTIPRNSIPMDYRMKYDIASIYAVVGNKDRYRELSKEIVLEVKNLIDKPVNEPLYKYNPLIILYYSYEGLEMYKEAESLLPLIKAAYPQQKGINETIERMYNELQTRRSADSIKTGTTAIKTPHRGLKDYQKRGHK